MANTQYSPERASDLVAFISSLGDMFGRIQVSADKLKTLRGDEVVVVGAARLRADIAKAIKGLEGSLKDCVYNTEHRIKVPVTKNSVHSPSLPAVVQPGRAAKKKKRGAEK